MRIATKLKILLIISLFIIIALVMSYIKGFMDVNKQINETAFSLANLKSIVNTRLYINQQAKQSVEMISFPNKKNSLNESNAKVKQSFRALILSAESSKKHDSIYRENRNIEKAKEIEKKYDAWTSINAFAIKLAYNKGTKEAYNYLKEKSERIIRNELFSELDHTVQDEIDEIYETYNRLFIGMGFIPWSNYIIEERLNITKFALDYFMTIDETKYKIDKQTIVLENYINTGDESYEHEFEILQISIDESFKHWRMIIDKQTNLGVPGEEKDLRKVISIEKEYYSIIPLDYKFFRLVKANRNKEAIKYLHDTVEPLINKVLIPKINDAVEDSNHELSMVYKELLDFSYSSVVERIVVLSIISLLLFYFIINLIRSIIVPLNKINAGAKIIGIGNLDYQIDIKKKNEFSDLAVSFNTMVQDLKKTLTSRDYLNNIISSLNDMLCVISIDGYIQTVNPAFLLKLGYSSNEILGNSIDMILTDEEALLTVSFLNEINTKGYINNVEKIYCSKDKRKIIVNISASRIYDNIHNMYRIVLASQDITEHKLAEKALRKSEKRYRELVENINDVYYICDSRGRLIYWSPNFLYETGLSEEEVIGKFYARFIVQEDRKRIMQFYTKGSNDGTERASCEFRVNRKNKKPLWVAQTTRFVRDINGGVAEYHSVVQIIEERKKAEEQIRKSLNEKEVLLKEIHHRVKNNLQVISSLLYLNSKQVKNKEALALFKDSQNRVKSIALVHERLYQSTDFDSIDLGDYIKRLSNDLFRSYGINPYVIRFVLIANNIEVNIDKAIPCGLIINELLSNSLKYAFPNGKEGTIEVKITKDRDDLYSLSVSDNGIGLPSDLDIHNLKSLGIKLVENLVNQLQGKMEYNGENGTTFNIFFK